MNPPPSTSKNWFVCSRFKPDVETRLFLFPYAGGGPAVFSRWAVEFPDTIETRIAHYPGRGSRHNEPPIKRIFTLVEKLSTAIQPLLDKPFAFFGHSLGGLVAFELANYLRKNNFSQPTILFISACGAPHLSDPHQPIHALTDAEFLKALQELNGIPSDVLDYPEIMEVLLPTLRADFEIVESYRHIPNELSLDIPIIVYGGLNDPRISREQLEGWASHTNSNFKSNYFPGNHFFINTARDEIVRLIAREMMSSPTMKHQSE